MNTIIACVTENLRYFRFSLKMVYILFFSVIILCGIQYSNYKDTIKICDEYMDCFDNDKITDVDDGNIEELKEYKKTKLQQFLFSISPSNATNRILESTLIIFPIVLIIIATIVSSMDRANKVYKIKKVFCSKKKYILSQKLTMYLLLLQLCVVLYIIGKISNYIMYNSLIKKYNLSEFEILHTEKCGIGLFCKRIVIVFLFAIAIMELSSLFNTVFKNSIISMALLYLYFIGNSLMMFIRIDLQNSFKFLYRNYFDFICYDIVFYVNNGVTTMLAFVVILITIILAFVIDYYIGTKRSAFV